MSRHTGFNPESPANEEEPQSGGPLPFAPAASCGRVRVIASEELFGGAREVVIVHGEKTYRLIRTRQGKLLLNR